jgi:hypothetical protein
MNDHICLAKPSRLEECPIPMLDAMIWHWPMRNPDTVVAEIVTSDTFGTFPCGLSIIACQAHTLIQRCLHMQTYIQNPVDNGLKLSKVVILRLCAISYFTSLSWFYSLFLWTEARARWMRLVQNFLPRWDDDVSRDCVMAKALPLA